MVVIRLFIFGVFVRVFRFQVCPFHLSLLGIDCAREGIDTSWSRVCGDSDVPQRDAWRGIVLESDGNVSRDTCLHYQQLEEQEVSACASGDRERLSVVVG